jgi:hypothetical protein
VSKVPVNEKIQSQWNSLRVFSAVR